MSEESHSHTLLKGHIDAVKRMEDEIAEIREDIAERLKEARGQGFDGTKIREVVRWLRRVEKHGRAAMDDAEALFDLYRSVVDGKVDNFDAMMNDARDRALLKQFAPDDQITPKLSKRTAAAQTAAAMARAAKMARGE